MTDHPELRRDPEGRFEIIDLGSGTGTYVNGERVTRKALTEQDIVTIGGAAFRLSGGELLPCSGESPAATIRPAVPADAEGITRVNVETWLATYPNDELGITVELLRGYLVGAAGEKAAQRVDRFRKIIEASSAAGASNGTFVALSGGVIVGYALPHITGEGCHRVGALYVLPAFHGRGIGHLLLERTLAWHGDGQDVYLQVAAYNQRAMRFYERHGFVRTGGEGHDDVAAFGDVRIPELEMLRRGRA
jgi:GNAT superfamily N-acetyltransferase